ncbi:MAG: FTR1 family protein, partial [Terriglobales bacterium]
CVLVLAAIAAGAAQNRQSYQRAIAVGAGVGFAATLVTWNIAVRILSDLSKSISALALQAVTGLFAVVVLLIVMNWFFHKLYWTGWISFHNKRKKRLMERTKTDQASVLGLFWGMGLLGFTSVYREGFEVVLFLQSYRLRLGNEPVLRGVCIGVLFSGIVAVLTFVAHHKLPYRRMLVFTGILLGVVLVVMVGEQAQEMQLAHWVTTTRIPSLSHVIPSRIGLWLSIFPTVETLGAQAAAALLVLGSYIAANRAVRRHQSPEELDGSEAGGYRMGLVIFLAVCLLLFANQAVAEAPKENATASRQAGVLLMAHGGGKEWNDQVLGIVSQINATEPAEVAFGMADRDTLQAGLDRLVARGVKQIVAVPLFISSHSSVFDSLAYLLGIRKDPPADLATFASMDHDMKNMKTGSSPTPPSDKTKPVHCPVPIRMTAALDHHPIVGNILLDRANAISRRPRHEVVILVAHGPVSDEDNALWLQDMAVLARQLSSHRKFARVEYLTLRDDADDPIRNKATQELRQRVEEAANEHRHALIVPLLLSYGGIDSGLRKRLDGLDHTMSTQALLPDTRIAQWVLDNVRQTDDQPSRRNGS